MGVDERAEQAVWQVLLRPDHVVDLMDDTGIIQHANGAVPAWDTGYCVDDVARMVVVGAGLHRRRPDALSRRMVVVGLAFLGDAIGSSPATGGPGMHNFMAHDRRWLEEVHVGDHVGRAVWALGDVVVAYEQVAAIGGQAVRLLHQLLAVVARFDSLHEWAYAALGLGRALQVHDCERCREALRGCVAALEGRWAEHGSEAWPWPNPELIYDNARLPQALMVGAQALGRDDLVQLAGRSLDWFHELCRDEAGVVRTIGNHWLRDGETLRPFTGDEQPIDAGALCEALVEGSRVLQRPDLGQAAVAALDWFGGNNRLGLVMYDVVTAGCHDGLGGEAVNDNQGAESTLAFLQAALCVASAGSQAPRGLHVRTQSADRQQLQ